MIAARTDRNQKTVADEIRECLAGSTVMDLSGVGKGVPDLLVGWRGRNYLIEVKNPLQRASDQKLTPVQEDWHSKWQGSAFVATSAASAIAQIAESLQK